MKVVSAKVMAELESIAYKQGCSETDFMENAGMGIASKADDFINFHHLSDKILLLCGKGNNGGDAFVAGCYLRERGYQVTAIHPEDFKNCSPLCRTNGQRFLTMGGSIVKTVQPEFYSYGLILDGLFGTGFKGQIEEPYASLVLWANQSKIPILAIDIPSGLNGTTGEASDVTIKATETIFLGLPKIGFFLGTGWNYVGKLRYVDFGLPYSIIENAKADFVLLTQDRIKKLLPPIVRNRHKYQAGQVIGLSGSPGMPGAALLSSLAALRGGCGIVRLLYPAGMEAELSAAPYEVIKIGYTYDDLQEIVEYMRKGKAAFVGPGLGRTEQTKELLKDIMPLIDIPCVIDADALTLFAEGVFKKPKQAMFTPHAGEMQRLLDQSKALTLSKDTLGVCQKYAEEHGITLILKGAPTFIFHPGEDVSVNPTGDPGMATAGSGDVLTGLLAGLLAQGMDLKNVAELGVYLHGLAGEYAALDKTSYSMISSDIIECFKYAFQELLM